MLSNVCTISHCFFNQNISVFFFILQNIVLVQDEIVDDKQHNNNLRIDVNRKYLKYPPKDYRTDENIENSNVISEIPKKATTSLDDIFISVKTTYTNHRSRLALILQTWFQLSTAQVS